MGHLEFMRTDKTTPCDRLGLRPVRWLYMAAGVLLAWGAPLAPAAVATEQVEKEEPAIGVVREQSLPLFLGKPIEPGTLETRYWAGGQPVEGLAMPTPVLIASGVEPGPTLCLAAAVHGDELNGVEVIRRIMYSLETDKLKGTVIAVPIVNLHGFRRNSRYLPDRRDLNRYFPGNPQGSSASRIAYSFTTEIVDHCEYLIDLHTGSFHRTNLPQLRADLGDEKVARFSRLFGDIVVMHSRGLGGTLRRAATDLGIPTVTIEAGEPLRLQPREVEAGVKAVSTAMAGLGMLPESGSKQAEQPVYYDSIWLRADQSGVLFSEIPLGSKVGKGDILGSVTDPITNRSSVIRSPAEGRILGMALNQMVMPGFAAFHLGIKKGDTEYVAERAAERALEPVREVVEEKAREAAKTVAETTDDPQAVSAAARKAAEAATREVVKPVIREDDVAGESRRLDEEERLEPDTAEPASEHSPELEDHPQ